MALAFFTAGAVTHWRLRVMGEDPEIVYSLLIGAIVGGIVGAKIHYLVLHPDEFRVASFSGSGLVWYGGSVRRRRRRLPGRPFLAREEGRAGRRYRPRCRARVRSRTDRLLPQRRRLRCADQLALGSRVPQGVAAHDGRGPPDPTLRGVREHRHLRAAGLGDQPAHAPDRRPPMGVLGPGRHRAFRGGVRAHQPAGSAGTDAAAVDQHRADGRRRGRRLVDADPREGCRRGARAGVAAATRGQRTPPKKTTQGTAARGKRARAR